MCEKDLDGFHKKANTRLMENIIYKEIVEDLAISCLKGLDRFNNYPQTYKRLWLLEWFQTSSQRKQQKITALRA